MGVSLKCVSLEVPHFSTALKVNFFDNFGNAKNYSVCFYYHQRDISTDRFDNPIYCEKHSIQRAPHSFVVLEKEKDMSYGSICAQLAGMKSSAGLIAL